MAIYAVKLREDDERTYDFEGDPGFKPDDRVIAYTKRGQVKAWIAFEKETSDFDVLARIAPYREDEDA